MQNLHGPVHVAWISARNIFTTAGILRLKAPADPRHKNRPSSFAYVEGALPDQPVYKDVYDRFAMRLERPGVNPRLPVVHMTFDEIVQLQDELSKIVDPLLLPDLDQAARDGAAGKRFPEMQDLMIEVAAGLRRCPEIAEEIDVAAEVFEDAARQDMSLGAFLMAMQTLDAGADTGVLLAASEGDALVAQVEERFNAAVADPALPAENRGVLRYLFAEPQRQRTEAQKEAQGERAPTLEIEVDLQQRQERELSKARVAQLLSDVQSGRDVFLSRALGLPLPNPTPGMPGSGQGDKR